MDFQIKIYDFFTKGEVPVFRIGRHVKRSENLNRQGLSLITRKKVLAHEVCLTNNYGFIIFSFSRPRVNNEGITHNSSASTISFHKVMQTSASALALINWKDNKSRIIPHKTERDDLVMS
ncbi:hypothetical protein BIV59_01420 [Bacillus sp. MUM 13]|nr:hypothetical protein BIV59_01420 [Bacillus sp. MUM 13]